MFQSRLEASVGEESVDVLSYGIVLVPISQTVKPRDYSRKLLVNG